MNNETIIIILVSITAAVLLKEYCIWRYHRTPTREQWLARCAARFKERANLTDADAMSCAESQLEYLGYDLTENPEDAADDEMSCWTED